jgi:hypothetical protein
LIKFGETCLVQGYVHAVAGVKALNGRLVAVRGRVERRSAKRLRKIGRKALIMVRMKVMFEGVGGDWVLEAERMPSTTQRQNKVKSAKLIV